jgi:hypothetical protein
VSPAKGREHILGGLPGRVEEVGGARRVRRFVFDLHLQ